MVFEDTAVNETFLMGSFMVLASTSAYASITAKDSGGHSSGSSGGGGGVYSTTGSNISSSSSGAVGISSGSSSIVSRVGTSIATNSYTTMTPQYSVELNHNASLLGTTSRERSKSTALAATATTSVGELHEEDGDSETGLLELDIEQRGSELAGVYARSTAVAGQEGEMGLSRSGVDVDSTSTAAVTLVQSRSGTPVAGGGLPIYSNSSGASGVVQEREVKTGWGSLI